MQSLCDRKENVSIVGTKFREAKLKEVKEQSSNSEKEQPLIIYFEWDSSACFITWDLHYKSLMPRLNCYKISLQYMSV